MGARRVRLSTLLRTRRKDGGTSSPCTCCPAARGVGSALLAAAEAELCSIGYTRAFLYALDTGLPARRFYERRGYAPDGASVPAEIGGETVTDLRYVKMIARGE